MRIRLILVALCSLASSIQAGELRLRSDCQAAGALIRLADVAEFDDVPDDDRRELEQLPLFPAPRAGLSRTVTAQDVRETMSLYGLSLPRLRVSGQCRVEGYGTGEPMETAFHAAKYSIGDSEAEQPESTSEFLSARLIAYLQTKERIRTQWKAEPQLTGPQAEAIAEMEDPQVTGGQAPWTGRQVFSVRDRNAPGSKSTTFKADVVRIARAIVARRQLAPGDLIAADDVELSEVNPVALTTGAVLTLDEAVGKEAKQSIAAGQVLASTALRRPLVVKRGELITVYSVAAGVQVKATAKALADAALGDVILLQATQTKKQFQGRVTAAQEAMVFVDSPKVAGESSPPVAERVAERKVR
jgi:flagella basal body P-ring formation protein FlgA